MRGRVRVFIACSLDGFVAGPGNDLSWLPQPSPERPEDYGYNQFYREIGTVLMGRRTYDVARGFAGAWPYGKTPVVVASHRPIRSELRTVRGVQGAIRSLVRVAQDAAGARDVYLDGGDLIRQALDEDLVDELTVSIVPVILGAGTPLFAGKKERQVLKLRRSQSFSDGVVQLTYAVIHG